MAKIDYLTEDTFIASDQKFVCLSFLTDSTNKTSLSGIKIRGVFSTYELACEQAKKIQTIDPYFNVFVGDTGKWLPFDPNPDSEAVKDSEYANEQLNNLMKGYVENQEKSKIFHEQRKTELMRKSILENLEAKENDIKDVKKEINKNTDETVETVETVDPSILTNKLKLFEEQYEKMNKKKIDLDTELEKLSKSLKGKGDDFAPPKIITTD